MVMRTDREKVSNDSRGKAKDSEKTEIRTGIRV